FGTSRKTAAESLEISYDTFKSFTERIEQDGLSALLDRRIRHQAFPEIKENTVQEIQKVQVKSQDDYLYINLESGSNLFKIPSNNSIQVKTILLTLLDNKLIASNTVSELLDYSPSHIQRLHQKLQNNDVGLFIDQRQGQQKNLVFNPEIQTQVFQQFIANLVTGRSVSSQELSENLKDRCNIDLPSRTIRYHLEKSRLSKIKKTLPGLLESLKKTPKYNN
ncbi:MAG: helix-turn-helix domain-containing protein, partial [Candidatus Cloacimonetes bacterium]|nr:helix-turn-helix domain-containing protein [Candidatus Cloacimonadota bacterium]